MQTINIDDTDELGLIEAVECHCDQCEYSMGNGRIPVLDHGYVRLVDTMGTDLTIVNAARVSFNKESNELSEVDEKLIDYLIKHNHNSPLRHAVMTFETCAPLEVNQQWYKHAVASANISSQNGWSQESRRYVKYVPEFYTPERFQKAPTDAKQGAGEYVDDRLNDWMRDKLGHVQMLGAMYYELAVEKGIAPEQARLLLPAYGMYSTWRWTASLDAVLNFLTLRLGDGSQSEITEYAKAIENLTFDAFPVTAKAYQEHRSN